MSAPDNPFAALETQQRQQENGNPFTSVATTPQEQQPQSQPGFLQRAYETSPLPGVIQAAQQSIADFVKGPDQANQAFTEMVGSLSQGNFSDAAHHAAKLLTGSENPFQDAAKHVIKEYTVNALANLKKVQQGDVSEVPAGNAVKKYIADVKAGNTSGAVGDFVGGVASIAPMLLGDEASVGKVKGAAEGVADAAGKVKPLVSEEAAAATAQPELQGAVRNAAEGVGTKLRASEGVSPEPSPSIRGSIENVADATLDKSKATYGKLDDLSGGRWQRFDDALKNVRDKIDELSGVDDSKVAELETKRASIEQSQQSLIKELVDSGQIGEGEAETARSDYKRAQALYDLDTAIKNSTEGVRPDQARPGASPETVNPQKLITRLNKLNDVGRLEEALGKQGAADIINDVDRSARQKTSAVNRAKFVKRVAKYAGYGAAAVVGGKGLAHVLSGGGGK